MNSTFVRIFDEYNTAQAAVEALTKAGVKQDDVTIVTERGSRA